MIVKPIIIYDIPDLMKRHSICWFIRSMTEFKIDCFFDAEKFAYEVSKIGPCVGFTEI